MRKASSSGRALRSLICSGGLRNVVKQCLGILRGDLRDLDTELVGGLSITFTGWPAAPGEPYGEGFSSINAAMAAGLKVSRATASEITIASGKG